MGINKIARFKPFIWSLIWLAIILFVFFFMVSNVLAQEPTPTPSEVTDDQVNAVAKQMFCPVCENIPLDVCPTQACAQWRDLIRQKLASGWNEEQVKDYFVEYYGERVLGTPPARGINWLVYILPPVAILVGGVILFRTFRSWQPPAALKSAVFVGSSTSEERIHPEVAQGQPASGLNSTDVYVKRLEEELRKRD